MEPYTLPTRSGPDLAHVEELVARALSTPRAITPQVLQYLLAQHEVEGALVLSWIRERLETLESYEQDLLLSPLFTPDFESRVGFEAVLGSGWMEAAGVEALIGNLASRNLRMTLLHENQLLEAPLPLVVIERYVRLLHLDSELPLEAIEPFGALAPEVRTCLRDAAWHRPASRALLPALLAAARSVNREFPASVQFLTDFIRTYRPSSPQECRTFLGNLAEAYEVDLRKYQSGQRSFYDEELKGSYGGKWKVPDEVVAEHQSKIALARALRDAVGDGG